MTPHSLASCFGLQPPKDYFHMVIGDIARRNEFHPVRQYLDGLEWDGTPRIDRWLIEYARAKDTPYVRAVSALMLIAAVRIETAVSQSSQDHDGRSGSRIFRLLK